MTDAVSIATFSQYFYNIRVESYALARAFPMTKYRIMPVQ